MDAGLPQDVGIVKGPPPLRQVRTGKINILMLSGNTRPYFIFRLSDRVAGHDHAPKWFTRVAATCAQFVFKPALDVLRCDALFCIVFIYLFMYIY